MSVQRTNFSSSLANRMAIQLRGPIPKGKNAYGFKLALFSELHLHGKISDHTKIIKTF